MANEPTDAIMAANGYTALDKHTPIEEMDIVEITRTMEGIKTYSKRTYFYEMFTWNTTDADEHIRSNDTYILGGCVRHYPHNPGRRLRTIMKPVASSFHINRNVIKIWRREEI